MGDYEHTTDVRRPPEEVFAYLSDVSHLPEYFSGLEKAWSAGPEDVAVVANVEGERYEGTAWLHADHDARSMRWGAERTSAYHGELFVTGIGDEDSRVTVTLHTERAEGPAVRAGLEQTLAELKRILDGSGAERVD